MTLVVATLMVGLAIGWARGGRVRALARARLRGTVMLWVAVLAHGLLTLGAAGSASTARALLAAAHGAVLAFAWANRHLPGMALVALGSAANGTVMVANGAMPVSRRALQTISSAPPTPSGRHVLADELAGGARLIWLGDVVPVPPLGSVVSAGDVLLAAGVAVLLPALMCRWARQPQHRRAPPPVAGG